MTMCDFFEDTQCLAKKECTDFAECTMLANTSFTNCRLPCTHANADRSAFGVC